MVALVFHTVASAFFSKTNIKDGNNGSNLYPKEESSNKWPKHWLSITICPETLVIPTRPGPHRARLHRNALVLSPGQLVPCSEQGVDYQRFKSFAAQSCRHPDISTAGRDLGLNGCKIKTWKSRNKERESKQPGRS